jgi:hypothetical protein
VTVRRGGWAMDDMVRRGRMGNEPMVRMWVGVPPMDGLRALMRMGVLMYSGRTGGVWASVGTDGSGVSLWTVRPLRTGMNPVLRGPVGRRRGYTPAMYRGSCGGPVQGWRRRRSTCGGGGCGLAMDWTRRWPMKSSRGC